MNLLVYKKVKENYFTEKKIKTIVEQTLRGVREKLINCEISIHLVGESYIKKINKQYRGKDVITDVISFATQDISWGKQTEIDLGDLFICPKQIKRQAQDFEVDYQEEFKRILVHGVLHLCGFDHQTERDGKKMFALQERILKQL